MKCADCLRSEGGTAITADVSGKEMEMGLFQALCPVDDETRQWVEESGRQLLDLFGQKYLYAKQQVIPDESFIDWDYLAQEMDVHRIANKVCRIMDIDVSSVHIHMYDEDPNRDIVSRMPHHDEARDGTAGLYYHGSIDDCRIGIEARQLTDPLLMTATLAHEMAHYKLLGEYRMNDNDEPITDLTTVFFGLGLFTGNAVVQFRQYQEVGMHGWSMSRQGYLSQAEYGFAIALWTLFKDEDPDRIRRYMRPDLKAVFQKTLKFAKKTEYTCW